MATTESNGGAEAPLSQYEQALSAVSKRLLLVTLTILAGIVAVFALTALLGERFWVSWFCFGAGVLGGFVSIQQRLKKLSEREVMYMAGSRFSIWLVPIFSGIFALVGYLLFLSGLIRGPMFPAFSVNDFSIPATNDDLETFFTETYPASGEDFAKLAVWSFVAGFSERFIPDIIKGLAGKVNDRQLGAETPGDH